MTFSVVLLWLVYIVLAGKYGALLKGVEHPLLRLLLGFFGTAALAATFFWAFVGFHP